MRKGSQTNIPGRRVLRRHPKIVQPAVLAALTGSAQHRQFVK